jgi:RAD50-interacting protein 1
MLTHAQLDEARADLDRATRALDDHESGIQKKAEAFQEQQSDIDRRLINITEAKTSDDAVKTFEASMAKLRRLDLATGYLQLLQEIDTLGYFGWSYPQIS